MVMHTCAEDPSAATTHSRGEIVVAQMLACLSSAVQVKQTRGSSLTPDWIIPLEHFLHSSTVPFQCCLARHGTMQRVFLCDSCLSRLRLSSESTTRSTLKQPQPIKYTLHLHVTRPRLAHSQCSHCNDDVCACRVRQCITLRSCATSAVCDCIS